LPNLSFRTDPPVRPVIITADDHHEREVSRVRWDKERLSLQARGARCSPVRAWRGLACRGLA
jgi:hypothetical protein